MARRKAIRNMSLQEQADAILRKMEDKGLSTNFFFVTTFKRYRVQMATLEKLEQEMEQLTVKKTYVKGRENVCANPAIGEYCKVSQAANQTVSTLIAIIEKMSEGEAEKGNKFVEMMKEFS